MQVVPIEFSQLHTSVPSMSMARILYPPPGNTTTAAPVFLIFGENTVIVGMETLVRRIKGRPATRRSLAIVRLLSAGGFAGSPGARPGHTGKVRCSGSGGQRDAWLIEFGDSATTAARKRSAVLLISKTSRQIQPQRTDPPFGCRSVSCFLDSQPHRSQQSGQGSGKQQNSA